MSAANPFDAMDRLVRVELASGRTTSQIVGDIRPYIDAALETPGLSEDGQEAFLSTLDALTGDCRADQCYQDPTNTTLPTEAEIAAVPRWARVAFAARCARRVLPLFRHNWPDAPNAFSLRLSWVVELVESVAQYNDASEAESGPLTCAAYVVDAAINSRRNRQRAAKVIHATTKALVVFRDETNPLFQSLFAPVAKNAAVAIADCTAASREEYDAAWQAAVTTLRNDFDRIAHVAAVRYWTDNSPVPPDVFGPLWPDGPPARWPADESPEIFAHPPLSSVRVDEAVYSPGYVGERETTPGPLAGVGSVTEPAR